MLKKFLKKISVLFLSTAVVFSSATFFSPAFAANAVKLSGTATASTYDTGNNCVPGNAIDGDISTRWAGNGEGEWLKLDLGSLKEISYCSINWYNGSTRKTTFEIQVSEDDSNWTTVVNKRDSDASSSTETYDFPDTTARYVKLIGYGNTINTWNSINEFEVYGLSSSTKLPSEVLDLTNWKLTLPVNNAQEITQPELASFESEDFYVNNTGDGVVFKASCGSTTTTNSSYPRSELREMTDNGKTKASWSTNSGTHTMILDEKITHLPDVKPEVVVGQIHDASDDVIELRLEKSRFFVESNGTDVGTLDDNYQLGTRYTIKVVAANGVIKVYYNNVLKVTYNKVDSGCYFKAGMYTQSNTTKGDLPTAYGEDVIYNVQVTHK